MQCNKCVKELVHYTPMPSFQLYKKPCASIYMLPTVLSKLRLYVHLHFIVRGKNLNRLVLFKIQYLQRELTLYSLHICMLNFCFWFRLYRDGHNFPSVCLARWKLCFRDVIAYSCMRIFFYFWAILNAYNTMRNLINDF